MSKLLRSALAYSCYPFLGPVGVARYWGRVPYITVPASAFIDKTFDTPVRFNQDRPYGIPSEVKLDDSPTLHTTQNFTVRVPQGSADCQGFVFDHEGRPIHGACQPVPQQMKYRWRLHRDGVPFPYMKDMNAPRKFPGCMAVVIAGNQGQYYHWLFDALPKLALIEKFYSQVDHYFLPYSLPFQKDSLSILDIEARKLVNASENKWVASDDLIVPCHQVMTGYRHPHWACAWLRKTFLPAKSQKFRSGSRVYISRAKARNRKVSNEDEIVRTLGQLGFESYVLEDMGFFDQVALFEAAEVVVAPHGSGLANLVFCQPGTKVIELFPSRTIDIFYRLSSDVNLEYAFVQTRTKNIHRRIGEDFSINVIDLKTVLEHRNIY